VTDTSTEQNRVIAQLREREEQYRAIFQATSDALCIADQHGYVVEANPAACHLWGYSREDFLGLHVTAVTHPDHHDRIPDYFRTILAGNSVEIRSAGIRKDGAVFQTEVRGTSFTYRGQTHVLLAVRDVTERLRAEEQVRETESELVQTYEVLEQRVAERTRELSTLLEISHSVASTLELEPVLSLILDHLKTLVGYTGMGIFLVEGDYVRVIAYRGPLPVERLRGLQIPANIAPGYRAVVDAGAPIIVADLEASDPLARQFQELPPHLRATLRGIRSMLVVPLKVQDRIIGVMRIDHEQPHAFGERHAALALAVAGHVAGAVENARLYARAQDAAALEERQRLARELHDSVTQALYGVTMYAEAAASVLDAGDQETSSRYLREVRDTAQEALREMRLLLFELRPPVLAEEGLLAALQARLAAVEGRISGLETTFDVHCDPDLPAPVEEALYGIAQEALNNAFKHAQARTIRLSLHMNAGAVMMEIIDDGIGFERPPAVEPGTTSESSIRAGGFGLRTMAERAAQVGGTVTVQGSPGAGTVVHVEVPL
jgi:PAS domain S-box-containing protein